MLARITYVIVYYVLPTGAALLLLPSAAGCFVLAVLGPLVIWRVARMTVRESESGLIVRNFWRSYQIDRESVQSVDRVINPPTIFVPFPNADCPRIRLKDGGTVYVVLGTGGAKSALREARGPRLWHPGQRS